MRNTNYPIHLTGRLLNRLMPGWDGIVDGPNGYEIIWRDARPKPTEAELDAEYARMIAEEENKLQAKASREDSARSLMSKITSNENLTASELQTMIRLIARKIWAVE